MRDRRNTNLSISSVPSVPSASSPVIPIELEDTEKGRFLWLPATPIDNGLPSPLIKHERATRKSLRDRLSVFVTIKQAITILLLFLIFLGYNLHTFESSSNHDRHYELVDHDVKLSDVVGPVIVEDKHGRKRWSMNIPSSSSFPLQPHQYRDMCKKSEQVSDKVREMETKSSRVIGRALAGQSQSYYSIDRTYIDVSEAGLVSTSDDQTAIPVIGRSKDGLPVPKYVETCDRSMTFVMESEDAGFGHSLLLLWMSYGLAKQEGRAFFVDDSRWQYGSYLGYFPKPPQPFCAPPSASQIVPCPHQARHLVVSSATAPWTFGSKFHEHFENVRKAGARKQREIFSLLHSGYDALFAIANEDSDYYHERTELLHSTNKPVVGMHIRRGDRHPYEPEFSNDYLPLERFTSTALSLLPTFNSTSEHASILIASDDPDIIVSPSLLETIPSDLPISLEKTQDRIALASKRTLQPSTPERKGAYTKHVDENSGWEGGFFASLFRSLGKSGRMSYPVFSSAKELKESIEQMKDLASEDDGGEGAKMLKTLVGRAWVLDMAVLGEADGVVCAVSSASCRVLGVMMGWDAVESGSGAWRNVDDGRCWSWDGRR